MAVREQTSSFEPKPFGRYVLLQKLAVGGMAEIYKAKTYGVDGFEKLLAIKRILPHCSADAEFIRMLVDEAKLTVLLSHANIVQVYDLGKVGDDYFISMEFIGGTNLREVMSRQTDRSGKLPEEIAVYIISEMCKGLDYAHRKTDSQGNPLNIVHRDISPQNILISYEGEVKIVDFGIAKAAMNVSHTMAGILKGKVAYMSPEQALGKPIDQRTDIFSAGVVLYEMLTGEKLFSGETQFEVLNQIRTTRINTLMLPDHIPGPLKAILAKALAYNIKDRYLSAGDFQLDLTKYLYSSYVDFSPRLLASLLSNLFEKEIKRKETPITLDEKTRSVLVQQASGEAIVVHSQSKPIEKDTTAVSGVFSSVAERKPKHSWVVALGGIVIALLVGYAGYHYVVKDLIDRITTAGKTERPTSPTTPEDAGDLGSIRVESAPPGARILLNGEDTGLVTPNQIKKLAVGEEYQVTLLKENYKEVTKTVALTSVEEPIDILERLEALAKGSIEVHSTPEGAKIILNNRETGLMTPTKIEDLEVAKTHQLRLTLPSYQEWTGTADVKDAQPVKIAAVLTPVAPVFTPPVVPTIPPVSPVTPTTPTPPPTAMTTPVTPPITTPTVPTTPVAPPVTPPVTPTVPTVTYGRLRITSEPAGARIYLNGRSTGQNTPATLERLEGGKRVTVALNRGGYQDWSRTVTIEGDKTGSLTASLREIEKTPTTPTEPPVTPTEPYRPPPPPREVASIPKEPDVPERTVGGKTGTLSINSDPSGAEVFVNSEFKGTTPIKVASIPPGTVKITVSKDGYMRQTTSVNLSPGESKSVGTIRLGGLYGEVSVASQPPRAYVIFDGERIGARTPVTIRRVPRDRSHSIRVELEGYRPWEGSVSLKDKDSKRYDVNLEKN